MRVLGIDEAGRGCVFGDLVIAGFLAINPDEDALRAAGAADSKALSAARRLEAREQLRPLGDVTIRRVTPQQIDAENLNRLEEAVIIDLVTRYEPDLVLLDALGHPSTLPNLRARLQRALPKVWRPSGRSSPKPTRRTLWWERLRSSPRPTAMPRWPSLPRRSATLARATPATRKPRPGSPRGHARARRGLRLSARGGPRSPNSPSRP